MDKKDEIRKTMESEKFKKALKEQIEKDQKQMKEKEEKKQG